MPSSTISRASRVSRYSRVSAEGGKTSKKYGGKARSVKSQGSLGISYAHTRIQDELREANLAAEKARRENMKKNRNFAIVKREMENRKRNKDKVRFLTINVVTSVQKAFSLKIFKDDFGNARSRG